MLPERMAGTLATQLEKADHRPCLERLTQSQGQRREKLGIPDPVKVKILEYEKLKLKPKAILIQLRKAGLQQPTK